MSSIGKVYEFKINLEQLPSYKVMFDSSKTTMYGLVVGVKYFKDGSIDQSKGEAYDNQPLGEGFLQYEINLLRGNPRVHKFKFDGFITNVYVLRSGPIINATEYADSVDAAIMKLASFDNYSNIVGMDEDATDLITTPSAAPSANTPKKASKPFKVSSIARSMSLWVPPKGPSPSSVASAALAPAPAAPGAGGVTPALANQRVPPRSLSVSASDKSGPNSVIGSDVAPPAATPAPGGVTPAPNADLLGLSDATLNPVATPPVVINPDLLGLVADAPGGVTPTAAAAATPATPNPPTPNPPPAAPAAPAVTPAPAPAFGGESVDPITGVRTASIGGRPRVNSSRRRVRKTKHKRNKKHKSKKNIF